MGRMTSGAAVLAVVLAAAAALVVLPTRSSRAQSYSAAAAQPPAPQALPPTPPPPAPQASTPLTAQPPSPTPTSPSPILSDSDRNTAVVLLDQIETLVQGALAEKPEKWRLKDQGRVQVSRAALDEILAHVSQVKTMLTRGQP